MTGGLLYLIPGNHPSDGEDLVFSLNKGTLLYTLRVLRFRVRVYPKVL